MTYREWADDYLNESVKLKAKIAEIKEQMPSMPVQALQLENRESVPCIQCTLNVCKRTDFFRKGQVLFIEK